MDADARAWSVCGVVLAGGAGVRMGGSDKGWVEWRGRALIEHATAALAPQVEELAICANRSLERYTALGFAVWPDDVSGYLGPLAGIATALRRAAQPLLLTMPVDAPDPPHDLAWRLCDALEHRARTQVAIAHDGTRRQPLFALYRRGCAETVRARFTAGARAVWAVHDALPVVDVDFSDAAARFRNVNALRDTGDPA